MNSLEKDYLNQLTKQLENSDTIGKPVIQQWQIMLELLDQQESNLLDKKNLIRILTERMGEVSDENFRKRISLLKKELKAIHAGVEINNSKLGLSFNFDDTKLKHKIDENSQKAIIENNQHLQMRTELLVEPQASQTKLGILRQVLFSYAWDSNKQVLKLQRQFAEMLKDGLKNKPAKFKNSETINLFIDYQGFEEGENQKNQQEQMCQQTPYAIVCYTKRYILSDACKAEINHYLDEKGNNLPNRRAHIFPFDCKHNDMAERFKENLSSSLPLEFEYDNLLDFFERGTIAQKRQFVDKLVNTIYEWFDNLPTRPVPIKSDSTEKALIQANSKLVGIDNTQPLHANHQPNQLSGAVNIVEYMANWANQRDDKAERIFYLLGDFGSGKSTSCQMLTQTLMDRYKDSPDNTLPIYLDLKKLLQAFDTAQIARTPIATLLETMLSHTGLTHTTVNGDDIVRYILEKPCLLIFDGFDEIGQKLDKQQQTALLNALLDIFPTNIYQADLQRLAEKKTKENTVQSRILISCRTHFFRDNAEQQSFVRLQYRHEISQSFKNVKNYQLFYLLPFSNSQIENYLVKWLGNERGEQALKFIQTVHDLSGLSERPIMLNMIRNLLPELEEERKNNEHINASTLYKTLFDQVGYRDNGKHIIPLEEKRLLLAQFALYMWQERIHSIDVKELDDWVIRNATHYPQFNILMTTGKYDPSILLQDLHNASLLVRDAEDNYLFAHTSFFEFFIAVGIFEAVASANIYSFNDIFTHDELSNEVIQFLIDWRLTTKDRARQKFDTNWQKLQQADGSNHARLLAFNIWYFAYSLHQGFCTILSPNLQGLEISFVRLSKHHYSLDWSQANLSNTKFENCDFGNINFSHANFDNTYFLQNNFSQCQCYTTTIDNASFKHNRFYHCQLSDLILQNLSKDKTNFIMPLNESIKLEGKLLPHFVESDLFFHNTDLMQIHPNLPYVGILENNQVSLLDFEKNFIAYSFKYPTIRDFIFSPDGKLLVITCYEYLYFYEFSETIPHLGRTLKIDNLGLYFSEDSNHLAIFNAEFIHIFDIKKNFIEIRKHPLGNHDTNSFNSFCYNFDEDVCFLAKFNELVRITFNNNNAIFVKFGKTEYIHYTKLVLDKINNKVIVSTWDSIHCYNAQSLDIIFEEFVGNQITNIHLIGSLIYYNSNQGVYSFNLSTMQQSLVIQGDSDYFYITNDGLYLLMHISSVGLARLYNLRTKNEILALRPTGKTNAVQIIPDHPNLVVSNSFRLANWHTEKNVLERRQFLTANTSYSHSNNALKMIDEDNIILRHKEYVSIIDKNHAIKCTLVNELESNSIIYGQAKCDIGYKAQKAILIDYKKIRIGQIQDQMVVNCVVKHIEHLLVDVVFHPSLDIFYTLSHHRELIRWKFDSKKKDYIKTHEMIIEMPLGSLALSHCGNLLNVSESNTSLLLDSGNFEEIFTIRPIDGDYQGHISKFSNCDNYLILFDSNQLKIIEINTQEIIFDLKNHIYITDVSVDSKMGLVAIGSVKNTTYLYSLSSKELLAVYHSFADFWISYRDAEGFKPIKMGGDTWKFLTNITTNNQGELEIHSPDTHPAWQATYMNSTTKYLRD